MATSLVPLGAHELARTNEHIGKLGVELRSLMGEFITRLDEHVGEMVGEAATLTKVETDADYEAASRIGVRVANGRRSIAEFFKPTKQAIDEVKKFVLEQESGFVSTLQNEEARLGKLVTTFRAEKARVERERVAEENKRRLKEAEDKRIAEASRAAEAGHDQLAEVMLDAPVKVQEVKAEAVVPKVRGVKNTAPWVHRVVDKDLIPKEWWILDEKAIAAYGRIKKEQAAIPGVVFEQQEGTKF